jgi:hypothetical protein
MQDKLWLFFFCMGEKLASSRRSLRYLGELAYDTSLMWIPSHVGIQGNKRADILAKEGSTSGTLFQGQAGLTTVNTSDIHTRARTRLLTEWQEIWNDSEMGRYCCSIVPRVSLEAWMASALDERVFLVAMSRLASNHTGTRAHLQRTNVVQDALCQCAMGYDTIDRGLWECGLHWSRQFNKGYVGNAQYGRVEAHFWILKGLGSAHLVKFLRSSSDPLYTGSGFALLETNVNLVFQRTVKKTPR